MNKLITLVCIFMTFTILGANAKAKEAWKIVPNKDVCMVTNMHFSRTQIPVEQAGKTYYGCCENCKATIRNDPSSRMGTDPYSKKPVDKAAAVIAADERGSVLYFENRDNFKKYLADAIITQK